MAVAKDPNKIDGGEFTNVPTNAIGYTKITSCITVTVALKPQMTKEVRVGYPQLMGSHFLNNMENTDIQNMIREFTSYWRGTVAGVYMLGDIGVWSAGDKNLWKDYKHIIKEIVKGRAGKETRYWISNNTNVLIKMKVQGDNIHAIMNDNTWTTDCNGKDGPTSPSLQEAITSVAETL